jgi:serine/threonine protein kinase
MLVTTFMPGKTLQDVLDAGSITRSQAWSIALSLCDAVTAIHQLSPSLLHLDIKPLNIIVTADWNVRLIDFGIARWRDEQGRSGEIMGTPLYTSPEQWGGGTVSERSDLFSVGAVLQALFAQFDETPSLRSALKRATQQDPAERFATAAELREALMSARIAVHCQIGRPLASKLDYNCLPDNRFA